MKQPAQVRIAGVLRGGAYNPDKNIFVIYEGISAEETKHNARDLQDFEVLEEEDGI
jgi:hypothetical protein